MQKTYFILIQFSFKKILFFGFFLLIFNFLFVCSRAFALSSPDSAEQTWCNYTLYIQWPNYINQSDNIFFDIYTSKVSITKNIEQSGNSVSDISSNTKFQVRVVENWKQINSFEISKTWFYYKFNDIWEFDVEVFRNISWCVLYGKIHISVFKQNFVYIGTFLPEYNFDILSNIESKDQKVQTIITDNIDKNKQSKQILDLIKNIEHSQVIFFGVNKFSTDFEDIFLISEHTNISDKKIVIITDIPLPLAQKIIVPFLKKNKSDNIFLMSLQDYSTFLFEKSVWNDVDIAAYCTKIDLDYSRFGYSMNYLIDFLIYNGLDMQFLSNVLLLFVLLLVVSIFKHIIWLNWYGLYYPILGGIFLYNIGLERFLFLFAVSMLSRFLAYLMANKINLLLYAKNTIYFGLYIFVSMLSLFIISLFFRLQLDSSIDINLLLIIFFVFPFMVTKIPIYHWFWNKKLFFNIFGYALLSLLIYYIFSQSWFKNILIIYPNIFFGVLLLSLLVGRYTWLQFLEYFRFWKIIKKRIFKR